MHIVATILCLLVAPATVTAQQSGDTRPKPAANQLVLRIELAAPGSPVPRVTDKDAAPALAKVKAWDGRKVSWRLDGTVLPNRKDAEAALHRAARDPKNLRDSQHRPGQREPVPVRLEPGDGTRWGEVLTAYDMLLSAGFQDVQLEDVPTPWFVPRAVMEPISTTACWSCPGWSSANPTTGRRRAGRRSTCIRTVGSCRATRCCSRGRPARRTT